VFERIDCTEVLRRVRLLCTIASVLEALMESSLAMIALSSSFCGTILRGSLKNRSSLFHRCTIAQLRPKPTLPMV
jgi:hypothetical protein